DFSDQAIQKLGSGILLLTGVAEGKVSLIVRVSKDLTQRYRAGEIIKELATLVEGSGGGRPDMAQAGGTKVEGLPQVLQRIKEII
ncbi:MAG: DHHA1 domain-containing protein, partial [bacterium]|nr:DHHA1 domain-containing protein [bacterium]